MVMFIRPGKAIVIGWNVVIMNLDGEISRHILGYDINLGLARFSTEIIELDLENNTAKTESGSEYRLIGSPGNVHPVALEFFLGFDLKDCNSYELEF